MLVPGLLRRGDVVRVIAPSSPFDPELLVKGLAVLRDELGLLPRHRDDLYTRRGYLAGDDARRLAEWNEAVADPEARAIFAARGGYGAMRILPGIDPAPLLARPKVLVGFSDLTAIHALLNRAGLATVHGPVLTQLGRAPPEALAHLKSLLMGRRRGRGHAGARSLRSSGAGRGSSPARWSAPGRVEGPLLGGSLSLLAHLCGSPFLPALEGAILALEDVDERPYRLDRYLTQLRLAGALRGLAGVALGQFTDCDGQGLRGAEVVREWAAELGVPAVEGLPFGHEDAELRPPAGRAGDAGRPGRGRARAAAAPVRRVGRAAPARGGCVTAAAARRRGGARGRAGEGMAPALSACVISGGRTVHASCHGERGATCRGPVRPPDDPSTSPRSPRSLATTGVAAQLVAEGRLELDAPVASLLPVFEVGGKGAVTVRQLLAHASGLPAWRRCFDAAARDPGAAPPSCPPASAPARTASGLPSRPGAPGRRRCLAEPLEAVPGTRALYSDVGFIALGLALEAAGGAGARGALRGAALPPARPPLDVLPGRRRPGRARAGAAGRTLPSDRLERAPPRGLPGGGPRRQRLGHGRRGRPRRALLHRGGGGARWGRPGSTRSPGGDSVVPADAAGEFARRDATPGSDRALGWDTPGGPAPSIGDRLGRGPRGAIGHLGYTGCSLWLDLDAGLACALLTNHMHPGGVAQRERIRALRRRFHDAVAEAVGTAELTRR